MKLRHSISTVKRWLKEIGLEHFVVTCSKTIAELFSEKKTRCLGQRVRQLDRRNSNMGNKYKTINVVAKFEDKSQKLIIGSLVFNTLMISSLRLDNYTEPEVVASTYSLLQRHLQISIYRRRTLKRQIHPSRRS